MVPSKVRCRTTSNVHTFCYSYARFGPDLTTQDEILNKTCIEVFSLSSCIRKIYY